jgi:hypothetical protein
MKTVRKAYVTTPFQFLGNEMAFSTFVNMLRVEVPLAKIEVINADGDTVSAEITGSPNDLFAAGIYIGMKLAVMSGYPKSQPFSKN